MICPLSQCAGLLWPVASQSRVEDELCSHSRFAGGGTVEGPELVVPEDDLLLVVLITTDETKGGR